MYKEITGSAKEGNQHIELRNFRMREDALELSKKGVF